MGDFIFKRSGLEVLRIQAAADLNRAGRTLGFGECPRCGDSFYWKRAHITDFAERSGCFPLCQDCWWDLTPIKRVPFYAGLVLGTWLSPLHNPRLSDSERNNIVNVDWPAVEKAVLSGK
jgi:hypothetical protein